MIRTGDAPNGQAGTKAGFASLAGVSLRRNPHKGGKKSDITDALKAMKPTPQFVPPETPVDCQTMRDVTPRNSTDLVAYWDQLRQSRRFPPRELLRVSECAQLWPDSIMFRCEAGGAVRPDPGFATALRAHRRDGGTSAFEGRAEISALLSQWILTIARNAAAKSAPCRDSTSFDTGTGQMRYAATAVPFGTASVDHVLCSVSCAGRST